MRSAYYATIFNDRSVGFSLVTSLPDDQTPTTFIAERTFATREKAEEAAADWNNGFFTITDGTPGYSLRVSMRSGRFALIKQGGTLRKLGHEAERP